MSKSDTADFPFPVLADPLTRWRTGGPPSTASEADVRQVRAAVMAELGTLNFLDGGEDHLRLERARGGDGAALHELAARVEALAEGRALSAQELDDIAGSAYWLAMRLGSRSAAVPMLAMLGGLAWAEVTERGWDLSSDAAAPARDLVDTVIENLQAWKPRQAPAQVAAALGLGALARPQRRLPATGFREIEPPPAPDAPRLIRVAVGAPPTGGSDREKERLRPLVEGLPALAWPRPDHLAEQLRAEFPWAEAVVERITADLALGWRLSGRGERLPPLCIVGPPGCGKSRLVNRLAALVRAAGGPQATLFPVAGAADNRTLAGTAKGWAQSAPSLPAAAMLAGSVANPILALDELDKLGGSAANGDMRQSLLTMMEPTTAAAWFDEGLGVNLDLRHVTWLATANQWDRVDPLLRTRWRAVDMPQPRAVDFPVLLAGIRADLADEHGVAAEAVPELEPEIEAALRDGFRSGRLSARSLGRLVRRTLEAAAAAEMGMPRH